MPRILEDPPTHIRRQRSIHQPVSIPDVIVNRAISDPLSRHGELATTRYGYYVRDIDAGEEIHEAVRKLHCSRMVGVLWSIAEVSSRLEFGGASDSPDAAEVGVAG